MEVSLGIYALICILFYIVIPGYIFRRFYFNGEFSKQLSFTSNSTTNLFSSIFIGVLIQLAVVLVYNLCASTPIDLEGILNAFDSNFISSTPANNTENIDQISKFDGISDELFKAYLPYLGLIYMISGTVGFFLSKLIYITKIDATTKLFRFKNEWHYLLSGRILFFSKMKSASGNPNKLKVIYSYVDVLIADTDGTTQLYSGFVADYELNHLDISKLEKLHLIKTERWKLNEDGTRSRKNIPGNLLTIKGERIINLNSTYVCEREEDRVHRVFKRKRLLLLITQIISACIFLFVLFSFIFSFNIFGSEWYDSILKKSWWEKLLILYTINIGVGFITPFTIEADDDGNDRIEFIGRLPIIVKAILLGLLVTILICINK